MCPKFDRLHVKNAATMPRLTYCVFRQIGLRCPSVGQGAKVNSVEIAGPALH